MKLAVFTPYGTRQVEGSTLLQFAGFAAPSCSGTVSLICNGALSVCQRDEEERWNRSLRSCLRCRHEQQTLALHAAVQPIEFSQYLNARELQQTKDFVTGLSRGALREAKFEGSKLYPFARYLFETRNSDGDLSRVPDDETFLRRVMLAMTRAFVGAKNFVRSWSPQIVLCPGGEDFYTQAFAEGIRQGGATLSFFQWEPHLHAVIVSHSAKPTKWRCEVMVEPYQEVRRPTEQEEEGFREVAQFLDIPVSQLSLLSQHLRG